MTGKLKSGYVTTEGDDLYYEIWGQGEPLLMIPGGGGDAGFYTYVAEILSNDYQIILYDRRGNSRSSRNEPQNFEVSQQARDAATVIRATGHESAYVFGNSSGAVIALELATKHPEAVKTVVVHEPPVIRVLPDSEKWLRFFSGVYRMYYTLGYQAASLRFNLSVAIPFSAFRTVPKDFQERTAKYGNYQYMIKHEMVPVVNYNPDVQTIKRSNVKLFLAAGQYSLERNKYYSRTAPILAKLLNCEMITFPGHHLSYFDVPKEWADTLRRTLKRHYISDAFS